jgi:CDGSH-type Zn-finger protein
MEAMSASDMTSDQATPRISVTRNGPYQIDGIASLARRRPVTAEDGTPMTWRTTTRLAAEATMWLCRCGNSANKPFCDGSHKRVGFDGTETAPETTYADREARYPANGIVVHDDRSLCAHAGFCGNRITNVWKLAQTGATEDSAVRTQVVQMIEHCPSGALSFSLDGQVPIEPALPVEVAVIDDGPLWITGGVPIERSDGVAVETRNRVVLCRCGQSINKPFCDGSHAKAGFEDH